ncbi:MAG: hypothetical protein KA314_17165 [Chloroflexi bacterium]|nr:hypothetical protein [Chloroflexota bacterium]MBP8057564.1 hypothetical protein [Chloroflexota bacterium]
MNESNEGEQKPPQVPAPTDTTPPSGLGVYDRPKHNRLTIPVLIAILILALITAIIIWQLWL